ncbi:hypothetical protein [Cohaesibacter sp. ES.047]|uniref:hypothetical protein n=1 Tax=Cohaesibacter sp. ES.047 TaxID=1798205 RepID=UPI0012FD5867|nr:hypothetical protein [Cohaesibacter sp. ES.047]
MIGMEPISRAASPLRHGINRRALAGVDSGAKERAKKANPAEPTSEFTMPVSEHFSRTFFMKRWNHDEAYAVVPEDENHTPWSSAGDP